MNWVDDTIREFGHSIGIEGLTLNSEGVLCLTFENLGRLFIERADESVLVYLTREAPPYQAGVCKKALEAVHHGQGHPFPLHAALTGDNELAFLARIPENTFSFPVLEETINLLTRHHENVKTATR